jgi:hypothetical protein
MEMEYDPVPVHYEAASKAALDGPSANGADLSKPTELAFYLYFRTRHNAELFAECLRDEAFHAEVHRPLGRLKDGADERWTVVLLLNHKPEREFIDSMSARLEDFAIKCGGEFDGWEALTTR